MLMVTHEMELNARVASAVEARSGFRPLAIVNSRLPLRNMGRFRMLRLGMTVKSCGSQRAIKGVCMPQDTL